MWLCAARVLLRPPAADADAPEPAAHYCTRAAFDALIDRAEYDDAVQMCLIAQLAFGPKRCLRVAVEQHSREPGDVVLHLHHTSTTSDTSHAQQLLLHDVLLWALGSDCERQCADPVEPPPLHVCVPPSCDLPRVAPIARRVLMREATPYSLQAPWIHLPSQGHAPKHAQKGRVRHGAVSDRRGTVLVAPPGSGKTFVALSVLESNPMHTVIVAPCDKVARYWRHMLRLRVSKSVRAMCFVVSCAGSLAAARTRVAPQRVVIDDCVPLAGHAYHVAPHVLVLATHDRRLPHAVIDAPSHALVESMTLRTTLGRDSAEPVIVHPRVAYVSAPEEIREALSFLPLRMRERALRRPGAIRDDIMNLDLPAQVAACGDHCDVRCLVCLREKAPLLLHCARCTAAVCATCRRDLIAEQCPVCRAPEFDARRCPHAPPHPQYTAPAVGTYGTAKVRDAERRMKLLRDWVHHTKCAEVLDRAECTPVHVVTGDDDFIERAAKDLSWCTTIAHVNDISPGVYAACPQSTPIVFLEPPRHSAERDNFCRYSMNHDAYVLHVDVRGGRAV